MELRTWQALALLYWYVPFLDSTLYLIPGTLLLLITIIVYSSPRCVFHSQILYLLLRSSWILIILLLYFSVVCLIVVASIYYFQVCFVGAVKEDETGWYGVDRDGKVISRLLSLGGNGWQGAAGHVFRTKELRISCETPLFS